MQRRQFLIGTGATALLATAPGLALAAAEESEWIYLSPFKSDGNLSRCQAEVWFVGDGGNYYVVTASSAWRAEAARRGLTRTQVWVGMAGMWQRSNGAYLKLPSLQAEASLVGDAVEHARLLTQFGEKYSGEWGSWGPRFKNGLADGSRVMLKYQPTS